MAPHRQNVQGGDGGAQRPDVDRPRLLPGLPQSYRQQVRVAVGVAAGPGPHLVEVVVSHQYLGAVGVHHKAGAGEVGDFVLPGQDVVGKLAEIRQDHLLVPGLLLRLGQVSGNFLQIHVLTPFHR